MTEGGTTPPPGYKGRLSGDLMFEMFQLRRRLVGVAASLDTITPMVEKVREALDKERSRYELQSRQGQVLLLLPVCL